MNPKHTQDRKTSVVERDIGKHQHKMVIFDSYEVYAFCKKCGLHDWNGLNGKTDLESYQEKYPKAEVQSILD